MFSFFVYFKATDELYRKKTRTSDGIKKRTQIEKWKVLSRLPFKFSILSTWSEF